MVRAARCARGRTRGHDLLYFTGREVGGGATNLLHFGRVAEDRPGPRPLPPDRPREDPPEPAQVHLAGRADRAQGQGSSSRSRSRRSTSRASASATSSRAASGRATASPGDPLGGEREAAGAGRRPGSDAGEHVLEVDVTLDELAAILGEELELPDIEDKGKSKISNAKDRYTGIRRVGPESLRHFKRTYREALKRRSRSARFAPDKPDRRARSPTTSATARGRRSPSRSPTPSSST